MGESIRHFLPHGDAMVYVQEIVEGSESSCRCTALFPEGVPFAVDGEVRSYVAVEAAAQTIAVHQGRNDAAAGVSSSDSDDRIGYLVGLQGLELHAPTIPVNTPFDITVTQSASTPGLAVYDVEVHLKGETIVTALLKTYRSTAKA